MKKFIYFTFIFCLLMVPDIISQGSGNIPLMYKTKFDRQGGVGDLWGVKIYNVNYALVTLDGGLSIVNKNSPLSHRKFPFAIL